MGIWPLNVFLEVTSFFISVFGVKCPFFDGWHSFFCLWIIFLTFLKEFQKKWTFWKKKWAFVLYRARDERVRSPYSAFVLSTRWGSNHTFFALASSDVEAVSFVTASAFICSASASNFLKRAASGSTSITLKLTRFRFRFHCFEIYLLPFLI